MIKRNFGILASMSWNSNKWAAPATEEDIQNSNYDYVKEYGRMHEDLNFAQEVLPCEEDGSFIAYTPMFNTFPSTEESRYVAIVFFRSLDYHTGKNCIVGFYAFPDINKHDRNADNPLFNIYDWGNVASLKDDIVFLKESIEISNEIILKEKYVPAGKKLGQQGFNYLTYENVLKILDMATLLNPDDAKLKKIKFLFLRDFKI